MREIKQGSYMDYVLLFGGERNSYSNAMASRTWSGGGGMCYLLEDGLPGGYLLYVPDDTGTKLRLTYLYTAQARRGRGIARELFSFFVRELPRLHEAAGACLWVQAGEMQASFPVLSHLCKIFGFRETSASIVFRMAGKWNWHLWDAFAAWRGKQYVAYFQRQGYEVVSIADASEELREAVKTLDGGRYGNEEFCLRPFLEQKERRLSWSKSFLTHKGGRLAAISLVTHPDSRRLILEHVSAAEPLIGRGVAYLPTAASFSAMSACSDFSGADGMPELVFMMYENNDKANAFRKKMLGYTDMTKRRIRSYLLEIQR